MVTPYRKPLFEALAEDERIDQLRVLVCTDREVDRHWKVESAASYEVKRLGGFTINFRRNGRGLRILHLRLGIFWELLRDRPDVLIIGDASWTAYFAVIGCLFFNIPYVVWSEITTSSQVRRGLLSKLRRFIFSRARACIASGSLAQDFLLQHGCRPDKITIARNAVDNDFFLRQRRLLEPKREEIRRELGIHPDAFVLLYVGQLISRKRIMETLEACAYASKDYRLHLLIAGVGPLKQALVRRAKEVGLERVHFLGFVEEQKLCQFYAASDGLVLLSDDEPWGMVINEAMLFGKPYLATTDVAAAVEFADQGAGYLISDMSRLGDVFNEFVKGASSYKNQNFILPDAHDMSSAFIRALK